MASGTSHYHTSLANMPMHDYCIEAPLPTSKEVEQVKPERATGSLHQSEATTTSVLHHEQQGWMPQEEQNLIRRLDRVLLPLLVVSYGLQYYDKAMLSQAVSHWGTQNKQANHSCT
jgi:hypothetical protein